jgi:signal peptidase I
LVEKTDKISASRLADYGKRKVWLAALLAIIFPGMGQLYNGQLLLAGIILIVVTISHVLISIQVESLPIILISVNYAIYVTAIVLAVIKAKRCRGGYITKNWNNWIFYMVFLMLGLILTSLPGQTLYTFHLVESECMSTVYNNEDVLYVNRIAYTFTKPQDEEIVLFRMPTDPGRRSLGRIWATGGAEIAIRDNAVFLDGYQILSSSKAQIAISSVEGAEMDIKERESMENIIIPKDSYLIIGDNSLGWADETCCGVVPKALIEGRVEYIFHDNGGDESPKNSSIKLLFFHLFFR